MSRLTHAQRVVILTLAGFLFRLTAGLRAAVIARDGAAYLEQARALSGESLLSHQYPPGYPLWIALWGKLTGGVTEIAGVLASASAGALAIPAVAILATRAAGPRAGLYAALLAALLPLHVLLGGEVLSDALHLALVAWTLVGVQHLLEDGRAPLLTALGAAVVGFAAYLTRPEALVVAGVGWLAVWLVRRPDTPWSARARDAGALLAPGALLLVPVLSAFAAAKTPTGSGVGAFKLTLKQDVWGILAAHTVGGYAANVGGQAIEWVKALAVAAPLLVVAAIGRSRAEPAARRLAWLTGAAGLALLLAFAVIRIDRRYAATLALLLLPLAGFGAALLARSRRRALTLAAVIVLASFPFGLKTLHRKKASYRTAGEFLRTVGAKVILARDSRAAYYAGGGARTVPFVENVADPRAPKATELALLILQEDVDALVLPIERPADEELSRDFAIAFGYTRLTIREPGRVALDVLLIKRR